MKVRMTFSLPAAAALSPPSCGARPGATSPAASSMPRFIVAGCVLMALSVDVFLDPNDVVRRAASPRWRCSPTGSGAGPSASRCWCSTSRSCSSGYVLGVQFGPKTLAAAASSLLIDVLRPHLPIVQGEPLLYTAYGGLLYGLHGAGPPMRPPAARRFRPSCSNTSGARDVVVAAGDGLHRAAAGGLLLGLAPALYALIAGVGDGPVIDFVDVGVRARQHGVHHHQGARSRADRHPGRPGAGGIDPEGGGRLHRRGAMLLFTAVYPAPGARCRRSSARSTWRAFVVISPGHEVLGEGFAAEPAQGFRNSKCRRQSILSGARRAAVEGSPLCRRASTTCVAVRRPPLSMPCTLAHI